MRCLSFCGRREKKARVFRSPGLCCSYLNLLIFTVSVEPGTCLKGLFGGMRERFFRNPHRQEAHKLIFFRNVQDFCHLIAYMIRIGDMAFDPAALIPERHDRKQHVLNGRGVILHMKAFVSVRNYFLRQHADHRRSGCTGGRLYRLMQTF